MRIGMERPSDVETSTPFGDSPNGKEIFRSGALYLGDDQTLGEDELVLEILRAGRGRQRERKTDDRDLDDSHRVPPYV